MSLNVLSLFNGPKATNGQTVEIVGKCAIGATGAVGTHTGKGVTVTRTDTGDYTLTFATGAIAACLHADVQVVDATSAAAGTRYQFLVGALGTTTVTGTVVTDGNASADDVADPPSGSYLSWRIVVQLTNSNR